MQQIRHQQIRQANIHARLHIIFEERAEFQGQQQAGIQAIMQGHSPIMMIMRTGKGKSMLFMLPASSITKGTTIVIVPLVALQGDLQQRCQNMHISSIT